MLTQKPSFQPLTTLMQTVSLLHYHYNSYPESFLFKVQSACQNGQQRKLQFSALLQLSKWCSSLFVQPTIQNKFLEPWVNEVLIFWCNAFFESLSIIFAHKSFAAHFQSMCVADEQNDERLTLTKRWCKYSNSFLADNNGPLLSSNAIDYYLHVSSIASKG